MINMKHLPAAPILLAVLFMVLPPTWGAEQPQSGRTVWVESQVRDMKSFCERLSIDSSTDLECSYESAGPDARLMFIGPTQSTMRKHSSFISRVANDFCKYAASIHPNGEVFFIDQSFRYFSRKSCKGGDFRELTAAEVETLVGGSSPQGNNPMRELNAVCRELDGEPWASCSLEINSELYEIRVSVPDESSTGVFLERFEDGFFRVLCESSVTAGIGRGAAYLIAEDGSAQFESTCSEGRFERFVRVRKLPR